MLEIIPSSPKKSLTIKVPGSKSYTNRALLLAALAKGTSRLKNPLYSEDTLAMIKALRQLGVKISRKTDHLTVEGQNGNFKVPGNSILNLENAGTAVRSLTAVMASQNFKSVITGNTRMQKRPIIDLVQALQKLNVKITAKNDCPPVTINGKGLKGGRTVVKGDISSQYLSALLMAAPLAENEVIIDVKGDLASKPYIEMTLDIMRHFGVKVTNNNFKSFKIKPQSYKATNYPIERDASSASYPLALAAIH
ncbi:3-phosphoshikimate 1-carboxyvinyltransferase, partial [Candidatus Peregrinibacteria bacterium]|nr:3-phosphoshikimate 1-carboxyvinyltransferase [Candidatus Peregrinibacteria bacterium]